MVKITFFIHNSGFLTVNLCKALQIYIYIEHEKYLCILQNRLQ